MSQYDDVPAGPSPRQRRQRRSMITLGVVLLLLFFAFWYAYSYYRSDAGEPQLASSPSPTCSSPAPGTVAPSQVQVRVLNATNRNGLAGSVGKELKDRGFVVIKVANDTSKDKAPEVAVIRHGKDGAAQASALLAVMPDGTTLVDDGRQGATVDVALGAGYKQLKAVPTPSAGALPPCPDPSASS